MRISNVVLNLFLFSKLRVSGENHVIVWFYNLLFSWSDISNTTQTLNGHRLFYPKIIPILIPNTPFLRTIIIIFYELP